MKRDCWVLDASVLIKTLLNEEHSEHATQLWDADARLIAPVHAIVECSNALLKKARRGECTPEAASDAARSLAQLPMDWMPLHSFHASTALEAARSGGFTSHDAVYLLLAEDHDVRLVTADTRLLRAAAESTRWQSRVVALAQWPEASSAT